MFSDSALATDIETLGLHVLLGDEGDLSRPGVLEAAERAGSFVVVISENLENPFRIVRVANPESSFRRREGMAIEMLSSGTTGTPKRISLTYENLESALGSSGPRAASRTSTEESPHLEARPALVWHPIVHISGILFVIDAISSGRPTILMERFDAETWAHFVEVYQVRMAHLNPSAMRMILDANIEPSRLSSLRVLRGGTAATPAELQLAFEDRFHIPLLTTYGATEFTGAVASWSPEDYRLFGRTKLGSSGRAHPGVALRVIDVVTGDVLPVGEEGVLEVCAPQAAKSDHEWSRTTDLAVVDSDGFLWIKGRVDDAIIRGGFKVHPGKIVRALEEHPNVYEAAVVGIPDERLGEVPVAAVTLREGMADSPSTEELRSFLQSRLSTYEIPRQILIVDRLPRTPSMKVSRPELRALFLSS
jgi:acyl-coenzyme A synthetase/AMP-(fatty) acid ligase